jgi:hypothetical protein
VDVVKQLFVNEEVLAEFKTKSEPSDLGA